MAHYLELKTKMIRFKAVMKVMTVLTFAHLTLIHVTFFYRHVFHTKTQKVSFLIFSYVSHFGSQVVEGEYSLLVSLSETSYFLTLLQQLKIIDTYGRSV